MTRTFISVAAILGGLSVAAGAFASHALREKLSEQALEIFETAARYQMYHALALLLVALLLSLLKEVAGGSSGEPLSRAEFPQPILIATGWLFIVGIAIFSGSLYALSLTGVKVLGAITPLGGAAFLAGWGALAIAAWTFKY